MWFVVEDDCLVVFKTTVSLGMNWNLLCGQGQFCSFIVSFEMICNVFFFWLWKVHGLFDVIVRVAAFSLHFPDQNGKKWEERMRIRERKRLPSKTCHYSQNKDSSRFIVECQSIHRGVDATARSKCE